MIAIKFTLEDMSPTLQERKVSLMGAIEATMGALGDLLYQTVQGNIGGGILHSKSGGLAAAVQKTPVETSGGLSSVWVEIPDDGSAEFTYGMTLEWGGLQAYDIVPIEQRFAAFLGPEGGGGKESIFSGLESVALGEGRLPHALMWTDGGGMHFAKIVHHLPSKEFRYMRTSLDEVEDTAMTWLTETLNYVLGGEAAA